eukprot:5661271-Alexandrium_andersonii.AAC.1
MDTAMVRQSVLLFRSVACAAGLGRPRRCQGLCRRVRGSSVGGVLRLEVHQGRPRIFAPLRGACFQRYLPSTDSDIGRWGP